MKKVSDLLLMLKEISEEKEYGYGYGVDAFFLLGYLYEIGQLVPQDFAKSFAFYRQAFEFPLPRPGMCETSRTIRYRTLAAYNMWFLHVFGHAEIKANEDILKWVKLSEEHSNYPLLFQIGTMYELGIIFSRDYKKAHKYYRLSMSGYFGNPHAAIRLGIMFERGLGCAQDLKKAKEFYSIAQGDNFELGRLFLRSDLADIWPNEEWISQNESSDLGKSYGNSYGMKELHKVIAKCHNNIELSSHVLEEDIDIVRWIQTLIFTGVANNTYNIGKNALLALNNFFDENSAYLSDFMLVLPIFARASSTVETYVKLYLRAKALLTRAKDAGSFEAESQLHLLSNHKNRVEVICFSVYEKFAKCVSEDDKLWNQVLVIIKKHQEQIDKCMMNISTFPNDNLLEVIEDAIQDSNVDEYIMWSTLILDDKKREELDRRFLGIAVNVRDTGYATKFIVEGLSNLNYIIDEKSISPLEFLIIDHSTFGMKELLQRRDVDVNFNAPIFTAIERENIDALQILLDHPLIDLSTKKNINGRLMSVEEFANKCTNPEIKQLIKDHVIKTQKASEPKLMDTLYFQYRKQNTNVSNQVEQDKRPPATSAKMYYE